MSCYNSLEPQAKEERNHSKPRAKEERNITSNLVRKKREAIRSSRTLNLVRKRGRASTRHEFQTSCEREREYYSKPRAKEERKFKVLKLFQISGRREFELQSPSENSKPCTEQGQNIRYHRCGKFKMSQVTHF